MKIRTLKSKALSMCLVVAIVATYSMVALAGNNKVVGEINFTGENVTVNGEVVKSGKTIFTSSTISTPANSSAVVNVNKVGKIKIAPNSTLKVAFDKNGITGDLLEGKVKAVDAKNNINFKTPNSELAALNTGEVISTIAQDDDDDDDGGNAWIVWALVFGGAVTGLLIAATTDNNRVALGGGATTVSPNN